MSQSSSASVCPPAPHPAGVLGGGLPPPRGGLSGLCRDWERASFPSLLLADVLQNGE